jgi:hypothetical protein
VDKSFPSLAHPLGEIEPSMQIDKAIDQLQSHGFHVTVRSWVLGDPTLCVATLADEADARSEDFIQAFKDVLWIYLRDGQWGFAKWEFTGGFGPNDIDFITPTLDEAVSVLLNYYFGEPIALGDWLVPVHMHPEWNMDRLRAAIDQAQPISHDTWDAIQREHQQLFSGRPRPATLSDTFPYLFVTISHVKKTNIQLHLKRDLRHAFVVPGSESPNPAL